VFRLIPSRDPSGGGVDRLELFLEGDSREHMDAPDNLIVTPWSDLWFAEDGADVNRLVEITPYGETYVFAYNRLNDSELCGPCFARRPDLLRQHPGPGAHLRHLGRVPAAQRLPPRRDRPRGAAASLGAGDSRELDEYAAMQGMSRFEAAAFDRMGVPLLS
jgi:secreted PhoX family phosphatase